MIPSLSVCGPARACPEGRAATSYSATRYPVTHAKSTTFIVTHHNVGSAALASDGASPVSPIFARGWRSLIRVEAAEGEAIPSVTLTIGICSPSS